MKKIVALVLSLVMVLGLATTAFAATAGSDLDAALLETQYTAELKPLAPAVPAAKSFPTWGVYQTNVDTKGVTYPEPKKLPDPYGRF